MTVADPIADLLTRIRNAVAVEHDTVMIPASKTKTAIVRILKDEGFIRDFEVLRDGPQNVIRIHLRYGEGKEAMIRGLKRISKPGLRVYVGKEEIPRVYGGLGIAIVSTSMGVMTGHQAWRQKAGGELLCYVW